MTMVGVGCLFFNACIVLFVYCELLLVYVNVNSWKENLQILCLHFLHFSFDS